MKAAIWGVPDPLANGYYFEFAEQVAAWRDVFTAVEWATRVQRDAKGVRARLDRLVQAKLLGRFGPFYVLPFWVRERVREWKERESRQAGETG